MKGGNRTNTALAETPEAIQDTENSLTILLLTFAVQGKLNFFPHFVISSP